MADSDALFTVTTANLNTGLRGIPVGTVRTSSVDPMTGVKYGGKPIMELADVDPEAAIWLLMHGELPSADALAEFGAELRSRYGVPDTVLKGLAALPKDAHPMEWLTTGLMLLGMRERSGSWRGDVLDAIAMSAELTAAIFRLRSGWGDPIPPRSDLGLVEGFVHMLGLPASPSAPRGGDPDRLVPLLRTFYVLHADHGGGNLSTFVGKAVASAEAHLYLSLASSMAALAGPLHGGANEACLDLVQRVGSSDPAAVEAFVRAELAAGRLMYGFGHGVLRAEDPRAKVQYALGERLCPNDPLFRTAVTMREVVPRVLLEQGKVSNPYPNVDAVSGTLLTACGLTDPSYYTVLFGFARIAGIAVQILHERTDLRQTPTGGKPVPIYRPKYVAVPHPPRSAT